MIGTLASAVALASSAVIGFNNGWERRWDGDSSWKRVIVPEDAMLDRPYVHDVALNDHGYKRGGILRYRKTFARPAAAADERLSLKFDGVYWDSTVYLNGVQVARRPHGWLGFEAPLADLRETNVVEVVCDVRTPCARWYTGAGLLRDVWLVRRRGYVLEPENVLLALERVEDGKAIVKVTVDGAEVVEPAGGRLEIAEPKWWSPDDPQLTEIRVTARDRQGRTDSRVFRWGLRTVSFTKDDGLHLNGRRVQVKGVCLHEGAPCVGNALCPELIEFQLAELKKIGVNAIRTAHNPMSTVFYDLCDRMGFLVMDELFDEWMCTDGKSKCGYTRYFREWWKTDLEAQVRRDRNHPSIILWSIGNEIPELRDAPGAEPAAPWVKRLVEAVRAVDPTRPVTSACPAPSKSLRNGTMDLLDVVGMNYSPQDYPAVRGRYRLVASETAAAFSLRDTFPTNGFVGHVAGCHPSALCWGTPSEQALKLQRDNPCCAGEFVWCGFDYLGEGNHPVDNEIRDYWPARSSYWGIFDRAGLPKDVAYLYRSQWSQEKTVHLLPNWEHPGREGQAIPVWCYTNAREAELFLNGRSQGVRRFADTDNLHLAWDVVYEPGVLEVRATFADGSVATDRRETPGAFSGLKTTVLFERNGIRIIRVDAVDAKGRRVTACDDEIELPLGGGVLLGADNGLPTDQTPFDAPRRRLFRGSLALVVRTGATAEVRVSTFDHPWQEGRLDVAPSTCADRLVLDLAKSDQTVMGFGCAMSELSWSALAKLSDEDRKAVLDEMFGADGGNFTVIRTPIGSSDFAWQYYSYDDHPGDFEMEKFSVKHDEQYLIPLIKEIQKRVPAEVLRIWASPWTPPTWMKVNGKYASRPYHKEYHDELRAKGLDPAHPDGFYPGNGLTQADYMFEGEDGFKPEDRYLAAYAKYFRKYVDAYKSYGIPLWMVMPQNEPNSTMVYSSCPWRTATLARFIGEHLGPALEGSGTEIFAGTIERPDLHYMSAVMAHPNARRYVKGAGFQWGGKWSVAFAHRRYPKLFLVQTEQECGAGLNNYEEARYCWELAKTYFRAGVSVYEYWNLALCDRQISPWGWLQNSLVTVDRKTRKAKFNAEYWGLKHLSHYVVRGSKRVETSGYDDALAFVRPDGRVVVIVGNADAKPKTVAISVGDRAYALTLPPKSLATVLR